MGEEEKLKEEGRWNSVKEGIGTNVMDGFGVRYITPYALSMGLSNFAIGFLSVFPTLLGNIFRISFNKMYYKGTRKKIILPLVFIQAFFWIPLILTGALYFFLGLKLIWASLLLLFCYSVITLAGVLIAPSWTSWMQDLVENKRGEYFGRRNRINTFVLIISMLSAGLILDYFEGGKVFFGFAILFVLASLGRYTSFYFFKKQYEPQASYDKSVYFSFWDFLKKMPSNNFGRFVIFVSLMSFAVAIASPFFSVYMLKELKFSYFIFTIITITPLISQVIFLPFVGKLSDKIGTVRVMKVSSFFISFLPLLWALSFFMKLDSWVLIAYLVAVELFSGFIWAGFNLASSNFIYDAVTKQKIILCFTYFSFINAVGAFFGGILGGKLASSSSFSIFGMSAILSVFLISFALRIIPSVFIARKLREVKQIDGSNIPISFAIREKVHTFWKTIFFNSPKHNG